MPLYNIKDDFKKYSVRKERIQYYCKNRGIKEPQKMSTEELLDTLGRYDSKRKVKSNRRKLLKIKLEEIAKKQNISKTELRKAEKL